MLFKKTILCAWIGLLCASPIIAENIPPSKGEEQLLKQISKGFSQVAKAATPAVVYIESQVEVKPSMRSGRGPQENPFDYFNDDFFNRFFGFPYQETPKARKETARGTGFLVTHDGYIMTNNHLVEGASKVSATLQNGQVLSAKVIGTDPKTDLAILKIEGKDFPFLAFGDSDALEVGDWAIAIGNPFGLQATVTVGVVSAKGRSQLQIADFEDFIQTDAAINPGNSGGPLLDVNAHVIGVNTAIASASGGYMGIGFAIPSKMASHIMEQLIKDGMVTRGFLGVTLQPVDVDLASFYDLESHHGALIADIIKGSPADQAGLKQEDVIIAYNGQKVENLNSFRTAVSLMPPGATLNLVVRRDGQTKNISVTIAALPAEISGPNSPMQKLGFKVQPLNPELSQQLGLKDLKAGILITDVESGSPAAMAGLRPGAIILAVNRKKVESLEEFQTALREGAVEGRILLKVVQGDSVRFVALHFD
ncbi:MAG: DegQ family serine endoprotease [Verrucomicrobia bacterium]|nr:DegQ family serine endoprotease [Verrucomicrobiota bacterium]MBS0646040.1 DegQ family serine endoprotease [Verrucomicrobiota bacterium]